MVEELVELIEFFEILVKVVQEGVHRDLINQDGLYKQLVKRQMLSKGYLLIWVEILIKAVICKSHFRNQQAQNLQAA